MQPKGDLAGCLSDFICQYQNINFIIKYITDENTFEVSSQDIKDVFENMDLNNYKIISTVKELIAENIAQ